MCKITNGMRFGSAELRIKQFWEVKIPNKFLGLKRINGWDSTYTDIHSIEYNPTAKISRVVFFLPFRMIQLMYFVFSLMRADAVAVRIFTLLFKDKWWM